VVGFQRVALSLDEQPNGRRVDAGIVGIERVLKNWRACGFNPKCHDQRGGGNRCINWSGDIVDVAARSILAAFGGRLLIVNWKIK